MSKVRLGTIAYARSGDKGAGFNIGVIANAQSDYERMRSVLTADKVKAFFRRLELTEVVRYELPNLGALNFVLYRAAGCEGTQSLCIDAQGKSLGQALLELEIELS